MTTKHMFASILILGSLFAGCKKYEEGPALSLRSREERVANTWQVDSYTINGTDHTSEFTSIGYTETYDKSGNFSYNTTLGSGAGKWSFQSDDEQIKRSGTASQSSETLYILKLNEKEFWYYFIDGNNKHIIHLEEN